MKPRALVLVILCALFGTGTARAQSDTLGYSTPTPRWVGQFTTLSANAVLGGLTAGVIQELRGGSFKDGFARGALGGTVIYTGKRIAAERFFGAGFAGREVAAVGASVVRNASNGRSTFGRLVFPVGIVKVYWDRTASEISGRIDAVATAYTIYGITEKQLHFDTHESLSAGAPVFRTDNKVITSRRLGEHAAGVQAEGVIFRADVPGWGENFLRRALAHERVHVLQDDQIFITWNEPLDHWLLSKTRASRAVARYVDLNVSTEMLRQLARFMKNDDRPWEIESVYLTRK